MSMRPDMHYIEPSSEAERLMWQSHLRRARPGIARRSALKVWGRRIFWTWLLGGVSLGIWATLDRTVEAQLRAVVAEAVERANQ